ncbi:MAG: hypothetical protein JSW62_01005, partial [Thermoplasmatales archaeon]
MMNNKNKLRPEEIVKYFKDEFKNKIKSVEIKKRASGSKKKETTTIWMKIDKASFKNIIKYLVDFQYPHLAIISGNDLGKTIELIYHFT